MRFWPVVVLVLVVVLAAGVAGMWSLGVWSPLPPGVLDPERLRLDRIKTGLTVAAGLAAGVTLLVALRRQALSERAQRFAENDALEQRTTALYVAAADQLGSDKAAVRLAGLYILERLGQDNPKLRQTVFDVWCAYLRMPYTPPVEVLQRNAERSPTWPGQDAPLPELKEEAERRQELEVRLTAQRLLTAHSRGRHDGMEPRSNYWLTNSDARLSVDLTGAVLMGFGLKDCELDGAAFGGAQFHGDADLSDAQFHGNADLSDAQFHGNAYLSEAQFHSDAKLGGVQFHGIAILGGVQFHGNADLGSAQFHLGAILDQAQFHGNAILGGVQFHGHAVLRQVQVHGITNLSAQFHGDADLSGAQFHSGVLLFGAQFHSGADLSGAQFHRGAAFEGAQFHGEADLTALRDLSGVWATSRTRLPADWVLSPVAATDDPLWLVVPVSELSDASDGSEDMPHESIDLPG